MPKNKIPNIVSIITITDNKDRTITYCTLPHLSLHIWIISRWMLLMNLNTDWIAITLQKVLEWEDFIKIKWMTISIEKKELHQ